MKKARLAFILLVFGVVFSAVQGCGSYNNSTTATTTLPTAAKRAFLVNQFNGVVDVINSATDQPTGATLSVNGNSDSIIVMSNKKSIVHSTGGSLVQINDATESVDGTVNSFPGATESIVPSQDGLFAYAAIPSLGQVAKMDLTTQAVTLIPAAAPLLPGVRHLAITHNGNTILAFSDNSEVVTSIDRSNSDAVASFLSLPVGSRPYTALFSSDDSTAYILNCGTECGGTVPASIVIVNMAAKTTQTRSVRAATVAVMDTTNLYVAGTDVTTNLGRLDVMNLSSLVVAPIATPISDGTHTKMALAANNKLYIGSKACSNSGGECLSVYNTSSGAAAILAGDASHPAVGDVTAITPIASRSAVYIIQNGTLTIYDSTTDAPQATQIFISGKVSDVKEVDN